VVRLTPPTLRALVSSAWGADRSYRGGWHEGLDFPGQVGEPVLAAAPGVVVVVDNVADSYAGRWIAIDHGEGIVSRYLHNERNEVQKGQRVSRSQTIARLGATGTHSSAPHVHFDTKGSDAAIADYVRRFGTPLTGFGRSTNLGRGMPSEPLMSGATWSDKAKAHALAAGVPLYKAPTWLYLVLAAGAGYYVYRQYGRRR
jgi:murein DD-endopeptidase MepM/ murein hydrolase activator NlpD